MKEKEPLRVGFNIFCTEGYSDEEIEEILEKIIQPLKVTKVIFRKNFAYVLPLTFDASKNDSWLWTVSSQLSRKEFEQKIRKLIEENQDKERPIFLRVTCPSDPL